METVKATHTPTPWTALENHVYTIDIPITQCFQYDNDTANANAAYIVRCVNSHEALVEALERAITAVDWMIEHHPKTEHTLLSTFDWNIAREALALARS